MSTSSTNEGRLIKTNEMADLLGYHPMTLIRKAKKFLKDGTFVEGVHFFKTGNSHSSSYLWNPSEIKKTFSDWRAPSKEV